MTTNKTDVETRERELIMKRTFDAPPEVAFEAFTSCEHLKHWWGPRTWPMKECTLDFRECGTWHYCLRGPNEGDESWGLSVYKEIKPSERLVYTDHFSDEEGNVSDDMPGMLITLEFQEESGRTRIVSSTRFDTDEELKKIVEMGAIEGMSETWDRLEEHLAAVTG